MALSIFNSDRIRIFLFAFVLLLLSAGIVNLVLYYCVESKLDDNLTDNFWREKIKKDTEHAIVILGDSRVYRGVDPGVMALLLPESGDIYNTAFSSQGIDSGYFDFVEQNKLCDRNVTHKRMIIIGLTPHSMSEQDPNAHRKSLVNQYRAETEFSGMTRILRPMDETRYKRIYRYFKPKKRKARQLVAVVSRKGFLGEDYVYSREKFEGGLKTYRHQLGKTRFSEKALQDLVKYTKKYVDAGIIVVGYRPPTSSTMETVENSGLAGFDENRMINAFKAAGGIWLTFDKDAYQTYDGSHLELKSAESFTKDLAQKVAPLLK